MEKVRTILLNRSAYADNDQEADALRLYLKDHKTFVVNLMSSPGSGKTTTLIKLINILKKDFKIGVMEADIDSDVDAINVAKETGVASIQLHTNGMCHLDAGMTKAGLDGINFNDFDLIFLENVGNLVCPAEFDTGSDINIMLLSTSEGHDKPLKYPLMFQVSKIAVISKMDVASIFDFDLAKAKENILYRNKDAKIFPVSAIKNEGVDELISYIDSLIKNKEK